MIGLLLFAAFNHGNSNKRHLTKEKSIKSLFKFWGKKNKASICSKFGPIHRDKWWNRVGYWSLDTNKNLHNHIVTVAEKYLKLCIYIFSIVAAHVVECTITYTCDHPSINFEPKWLFVLVCLELNYLFWNLSQH